MLPRIFKNINGAAFGDVCLSECYRDDRCQSFNYVFTWDICELSNLTKDARYFRYFSRLSAPNKTDPLNGVVGATMEDEYTINTSTMQKRWRRDFNKEEN